MWRKFRHLIPSWNASASPSGTITTNVMIHNTNAIPLAVSSVMPKNSVSTRHRHDLHASADAGICTMLPKHTKPSKITTSVTPRSCVAGNALNTHPNEAAMTHHSTTV